MTDLKNLLEDAAGDEPAITEDLLDADLNRGRRSATRRRSVGVVAAAAGTAGAVAAALLIAPGGPRAEPGIASTVTATPTPSGKASTRATPDRPSRPTKFELPIEERLPRAPAPATPVKLVPDGKVRPGTDLVCDLKPEGWKPVVWNESGEKHSELSYQHPTLHETGKYNPSTTRIRVRHAFFYDDGNGRKLVEKYDGTWDELSFRHRKAGDRTAVVSGSSQGPENDSNGLRDFHMKMSETRLIQVANSASALGWDLPTALRFVGSCHYK
jgi:hypothetical protein